MCVAAGAPCKRYLKHCVVECIATVTLNVTSCNFMQLASHTNSRSKKGPLSLKPLSSAAGQSWECLIYFDNPKRNMVSKVLGPSPPLSPGWFPDIIARVAFFQNWNEWLDCQLYQLQEFHGDSKVHHVLEMLWAFFYVPSRCWQILA